MSRLASALVLLSLLTAAPASASRGASSARAERAPSLDLGRELDRSHLMNQDELARIEALLRAAMEEADSGSSRGDREGRGAPDHGQEADDCSDGYIDYNNLERLFDDVDDDGSGGCFYEVALEGCVVTTAAWDAVSPGITIDSGYWAASAAPLNEYFDQPGFSWWSGSSSSACPVLDLDLSVRCSCDDGSGSMDFGSPGSTGTPMLEGSGGGTPGGFSFGGSLCTPVPLYLDLDGDGFGLELMEVACDDPGDALVPDGGDCDDDAPSIHPGATELPGTAADDNCNGSTTY